MGVLKKNQISLMCKKRIFPLIYTDKKNGRKHYKLKHLSQNLRNVKQSKKNEITLVISLSNLCCRDEGFAVTLAV